MHKCAWSYFYLKKNYCQANRAWETINIILDLSSFDMRLTISLTSVPIPALSAQLEISRLKSISRVKSLELLLPNFDRIAPFLPVSLVSSAGQGKVRF